MISKNFHRKYPDAQVYNLSEYYSKFVPFTVNSVYPIHSWYRFKEGYSRDLVHLILGTVGREAKACLDPFSGVGTTALACQEIGLDCHSIEVNPFLAHVAKSKLEIGYTTDGYDGALEVIRSTVYKNLMEDIPFPMMQTITKRKGAEKWLFSERVLEAILALRKSFVDLPAPYDDLFLTILSSTFSDVGNTVKDGKCVRYKPHWRDKVWKKREVINRFFKRAADLRPDIEFIQSYPWSNGGNKNRLVHGNSLLKFEDLLDNSFDIVITSPPYLNSFDYTDVYMPELWALGFVESYEDVKRLREQTLRSHVQVKWKAQEEKLGASAKTLMTQIGGEGVLWNATIPEMIGAYTIDMDILLGHVKRVLRPGGKLCIVVGTSSYSQIDVPTDLLIADIAIAHGFKFTELRILRKLKRSTQQYFVNNSQVPSLRESLIILEN